MKIEIESEPGKGSLFYFTARFARPVERLERQNSNGYQLKGLRALVVDDNATNCAVVAERLAVVGNGGRRCCERRRGADRDATVRD